MVCFQRRSYSEIGSLIGSPNGALSHVEQCSIFSEKEDLTKRGRLSRAYEGQLCGYRLHHDLSVGILLGDRCSVEYPGSNGLQLFGPPTLSCEFWCKHRLAWPRRSEIKMKESVNRDGLFCYCLLFVTLLGGICNSADRCDIRLLSVPPHLHILPKVH